MRVLILAGAALLALASCGDDRCELPVGCLAVDAACSCAEWETVSVEAVPVKFVVLSVDYGVLGNGTKIAYGWSPGTDSMLATASELGSRFRALVRVPGEPDAVAVVGDVAVEPLWPVTGSSAVFWLAGGDGAGSGSAYGRSSTTDLPSRAKDRFLIWANPAATVATDYAGGRKVNWSWAAVGDCFSPFGCYGPAVLSLTVAEIDGSLPAGDPYARPFLAGLTAEERSALLAHDAFFDPPGRDPATLSEDPRFQLLGTATLAPGAATHPTAEWTPCDGTLTDETFAPLVETSVDFAWSDWDFVLQYGVLSGKAECGPQQPGLAMGTSTPGCELDSLVYVDRAFGTLLFAPVTATASCTAE